MDKIIKLLDAGFTRDEILQMVGAQEPQPAEIPAAEPVQPTAEEPAPAPAPDISDEKYEALTEELTSLKKLVQDTNLKVRSYDNQPKAKTASDIIAELIDPRLNA